MIISSRKLNQYLDNQLVRSLAQVITDLKDIDESLIFIKDFFTEAELKTYAKRLAISYWLKKSRSYTNIKENLKVSSATIAEISSMTKSKGLQIALKKMEAEEWANIWSERIKKVCRI